MKKAALILIALCPIGAFAQAAKPSTGTATALIRLHYVSPGDIESLLSGSIVVAPDNALKAVVLRGNPEAVAKAEQMIQQLDVPQAKTSRRNVEITVYVIGATNKPVPQATALPHNLEPVVRQLKAIFPYSSYSFLNSMLIRSREGKKVVDTQGTLKAFPSAPPGSNPPTSIYSISYELLPQDPPEASRAIHLSGFRFGVREPIMTGVPHNYIEIDVALSANLDIPEGQKVVAGNIDIDGGDAALFVVLSARIE